MKTRYIFLLILLTWGTSMAPAQSVLHSPAAPPANTVTYTPDAFPEFTQKAPVISSYRYFWNFGDGHFKLLDQPNTNVTADVTQPFTYGYDQTTTANYTTQLQITQIYSPPTKPDDELKVGNSATIPITGGTMPVTGNNVDMHGSSLAIHPVRDIRPGYLMTFIVTYDIGRMGCNMGAGLTDWQFVFTYNANILEPPAGFSMLEGYNGETLANYTPGGPMDEVVVNITRPGTWVAGPDERYSFFLHFKVSEGAPVAAPLLAKGTFGEFDRQNMITFPCDSFFLPDMQVVKSYDPNYKLVSKDTITTNPAQLLHYVIHFQNTGKGPTDSIRIEDLLDPRLDHATLTLTSARIGYQHISTATLAANPDPALLPSTSYPWVTTNPTPMFKLSEEEPGPSQFTWYFKDAVLRGTKEPNYGEDFTEIETTGSIEFDIYTHPFMEYGIIIENEGHIFFDDNPVVITEPAQTIKYCCDILADSANPAAFDINAYFDSNVYPRIVSYHFTSDTANSTSRPIVKVDTTNYRCDYAPLAKGFTGLDVMTVVVCDNRTPPTCDTFDIHICANVDQKLSQYPCDTTKVSTAIWEEIPLADIHVYPNPTHDWVLVNHYSLGRKAQSLSIYNLQGQQVLEKAPDASGITKISLSRLPAGLYLLRVNEIWSKKIVKR